MNRCVLIIGVVLILRSAAPCQGSGGTNPRLTLNLPSGTLSESVDIKYVLMGPFGGYGDFVRPLPNLHSYEIEASHDGMAAETAKVIVYIPGCRFTVFTTLLTETSAIEKTLRCSALPTVSILGNVVPRGWLPAEPSEIAIIYEAFWACAFWELPDCMVPQFPVTTVPVSPEGTFEVALPDYSQDPITSDGSFDATLAQFSEDPTVLK